MSMLDIHQQALEETPSKYHEFLLAYKKGRRCIYGFVEGKTDPSYYADKVQSILPEGWEVDFWPAGGKRAVIKVFDSFDWTRFCKHQILFFVDRDFSPYIQENIASDKNIYITDFYSIENDLVCRDMCKRVLQDIKGLDRLCGTEMDNVLDLFESQLKIFHNKMQPISAHMIAWRRKGFRPCAENLKMQDMFGLHRGILKSLVRPGGKASVASYMCDKFQLNRKGLMPYIKGAMQDIKMESQSKRYVRGKYELWFMVTFCEYVRLNPREFSSVITNRPKPTCDLTVSNALSIIGSRTRNPVSLNEFLKGTAAVYACAGGTQ